MDEKMVKAKTGGPISPFFDWCKCNLNVFKDRRCIRLTSTIKDFKIEMEERIDKLGQENIPWVNAARELVKEAELSAKKKELDEGWRYLLSAQRMEIYGMGRDELERLVLILKREASEKVGKWRSEVITKILDETDDDGCIETLRNRVYQATMLRDDDFNNQYHKIGLKKDQLKILCGIISVTILLILLFFWRNPDVLRESIIPNDWRTICGILLFGLLGGAVSALLSLARTSTRSRIPEQISNFFITLVRTFIGAAAALVVYFILQAGIIELGYITSTALVFSIAFISGFSERFFKSAIESVTGKD